MRNPIAVVVERFRGWSNAQRGLAILLAGAFCLVLINGRRADEMGGVFKGPAAPTTEPEKEVFQDHPEDQDTTALRQEELKEITRGGAVPAARPLPGVPQSIAAQNVPLAPNPLITHTADLAVATKEFAKSRETMEEILQRHRGYAAKLRMVGQKSGSVLSATLRVPSTELVGTVNDLKALGDVEREEQAADEITQQHADLEARLTNARNTLRRLQELHQKQTYPDGNVRELQRQIANASAEVARLEAERQSSDQRVVFANLFFTLRETVATPAESFAAQLRGALASGFGDATASLATLLVFLIGRGPVVLLWCTILWLPVRWVWKRLATQPTAVAQGA
jgi:Domain of unknown function (DUF4349)